MSFKITDNVDQNHLTATLFKRAVTVAGLTLPTFDPKTVNTPEFTPATAAQVSEAAYNAATAGKDPSTDKEVQRLLMSKLLGDTIGGMYYRNQVALSRAELEHYQEHAPALLEELRTRFEEAVQAMEDAIPVIGHMELEDALRQVGNMSPARGAAVASAYSANARIRPLIDALPTIAAAAGQPLETGPRYGLLTYTTPSLQQFNEHRLDSQGTRNNHGRAHNVWDVLNDGVTVEMATTTAEVQDRIKRIEREADNSGRDYRAEAAQQSEARAQAKAMGF